MSIDRRRFLGLVSSFSAPVALGATHRREAAELIRERSHSSDTWGFAIEGPVSVIGIIVGCDRWPNQAACRVAQRQVEERGQEGFKSAFRTLDLQNPRPYPGADWAFVAANGDDPQNLDAAYRMASHYQASGVRAVVLAMRDQDAVWLTSSLRNDPKRGDALLKFELLADGPSNAPAVFESVTLDPLFDLLRMCELLSRSSEGLFGVDPDPETALMSSGRQGLIAEAGAGGAHRAQAAVDFAIDDIAKMAGARLLGQQLDMVVWVRLGIGGSPLREIRSVMERLRTRAVELGELRDVSFGHVLAHADPFLTVRVLVAPVPGLSSQGDFSPSEAGRTAFRGGVWRPTS